MVHIAFAEPIRIVLMGASVEIVALSGEWGEASENLGPISIGERTTLKPFKVKNVCKASGGAKADSGGVIPMKASGVVYLNTHNIVSQTEIKDADKAKPE